jgi:uridine kinase
MDAKVLIVGIGGGSAAGKTTFAELLIARLGKNNASLISYDAYYKGRDFYAEGESINYDNPNALDSKLCLQHLQQLKSGCQVSIPVYDFEKHSRTDNSITVKPAPVLILEGVLVLAEPILLSVLNLKIYVDTPDNVRLERRIQRDVSERGRSRESVLEQFKTSVHPMHEKFVEPSKQIADMVVPGSSFEIQETELILDQIRRLLLIS